MRTNITGITGAGYAAAAALVAVGTTGIAGLDANQRVAASRLVTVERRPEFRRHPLHHLTRPSRSVVA